MFNLVSFPIILSLLVSLNPLAQSWSPCCRTHTHGLLRKTQHKRACRHWHIRAVTWVHGRRPPTRLQDVFNTSRRSERLRESERERERGPRAKARGEQTMRDVWTRRVGEGVERWRHKPEIWSREKETETKSYRKRVQICPALCPDIKMKTPETKYSILPEVCGHPYSHIFVFWPESVLHGLVLAPSLQTKGNLDTTAYNSLHNSVLPA